MNRVTSSIGVTLLAFLVSGWGNVLASALCPHAMSGDHQAAVEAQPSCHASSPTAKPRSSVSSHHMTTGMKTNPAVTAERGPINAPSVAQPIGSCAHCFGPNESSTTLINAHGLILKKQDSGVAFEQPIYSGFEVAASFTRRFNPTQHSPPGSSTRQHLLLSVFLI